MSSRESADYYWPPRFRSIVGEGVSFPIHFKDETVFVYGIFRPGHLSHFLYDGMLPLYSTMKRFGGTTSSWLLRHAEYLGENLKDQALWEMEAILPHGKEIVLQPFEVMNASFQVLPPAKNTAPICFKRAVIGLGSQCGLNYCEHSTPAEVFQAYSRQIQEYYWPSSERWQEHLLLREQQAKIEKEQTKLGDRSLAISPTKCIRSARYYNFDGLGNSIPDQKEPRVRQGQRYPDLLETDPTGRITAMPVIAILEREGTRSVLNLDKVISTITRTGHFRLKVLSYDYGCGIPETAYLMRDVHILISPHGNALGGSIWMPSTLSPPSSTSSTKPFFPTVISIDSTRYYESWFQWTTTSMSQRFLIHRCGPAQSNHARIEEINSEVCPFHRDMELAQSALGKADLVLDTETEQKDMLELTGPEFPIDLWMKYGGEPINTFLNDYWKSLSRYADPVRLLKVLYQIRDENIANEGGNKSYLQLCRENKCCAPDCSGVMHRNIVGPLRAYDQDLSEERWGQLRQNKEHDLFVKSGETLKDWIP
ncbi:hypothetical protein BGZ83_000450 [Gryganskiella cystojenkinii]|nr:hypothetical protein BGZ83_000450 [Gryganskiella cystojenkinii]